MYHLSTDMYQCAPFRSKYVTRVYFLKRYCHSSFCSFLRDFDDCITIHLSVRFDLSIEMFLCNTGLSPKVLFLHYSLRTNFHCT